MKIQEIELKITEEALSALFQGKKIIFSQSANQRITIYPPRYGEFMTHEKMQEIKDLAYMKAWTELLELLSKKDIGDEFIQKF